MLDHTHDPQATSWIESANLPDSPFPIQSLPLARARVGDQLHALVAIGDLALDLTRLSQRHKLSVESLGEGSLVGLAQPEHRRELRHWLFDQLQQDRAILTRDLFLPLSEVSLELPFEVGDYTDFYASIHHATRVGSMFRPDNPLLPNYQWVPIGYHGRASSLIPSGTPVPRPAGQLKADDAPAPTFGPCKLLDYELELGLWVGQGNALGSPIPLARVDQHWIGISLVNDWSARDIQRWEYQPLGPFLAKSFATTVSPWLVTQEALAPFRCPAAERDSGLLDYLSEPQDRAQGGLDLELTVEINGHAVSHSNPKDLYWTLGQMLTHHASNGCPMRTGDLLASGTISGPSQEQAGCLLELTWAGPGQPRKAVEFPDGERRTFLLNGDEVRLSGWARKPGRRSLFLGECRGRVEAGPLG